MVKNIKYSLVLLIFFFSAVSFLRDTLFTGKTYYTRDLTYIFHPWKHFTVEELQQGRVPLWNPYAYSGMPLMANMQSQVFYPLSLVFYSLPFVKALKLFYLLHLILAGLGWYLFSQKKGVCAVVGITAGIMYMLSGYLVSKIEFLSLFASLAWLPWMLLFIDNWLMLGVVLGVSFLAGYPQIWGMQAGILIFYDFLQVIDNGRSNLRAGVLGKIRKYLYAGIIFAGLAAVQLFPAVELIANSQRGTMKLDYQTVTVNSAKGNDIINCFVPMLNSSGIKGQQQITGEKYYWATTGYIGEAVTSLLVVGIIFAFVVFIRDKKYKDIIKLLFLLMLAGMGLVLALGEKFWGYKFIYEHLLLFRYFRYPGGLMYIFSAAAVLILITTLPVIFEKLERKSNGSNNGYLWLIPAVVLINLLILSYKHLPVTSDRWYGYINHTAARLQYENIKNNSHPWERFFVSPATDRNRMFTTGNVEYAWKLSTEKLFNLISMKFHLFNFAGMGEPLELANSYSYALDIYEQKRFEDAKYLLGFANVRYVIADTDLNAELLCTTPAKVYLNDKTLSRAVFIPEKNAGTDGQLVSQSETKKKLVFEKVGITRYSPERVNLQLTQKRAGVVVLTDNWYPGWVVKVDGLNSKLEKFMKTFRAVKVNTGTLNIEFVYIPGMFCAGLSLTLLTVTILLIIGLRYATQKVVG
ncbi:MAG: YfhO family protein [Elusimicrobiota bacterium]